MASSKTSQLIRDLDSVPSIVGNLGLSIAAAQKAFNLEYLESLERLVPLIKSILGKKNLDDDDRTFFETLLTQLAPAAYQYTETSLAVRLDLAQSERKAASGKLGFATGAVTLSAGMSASYGLDYRAAAEVRTVIQARNLDPAAMKALLERAASLAEGNLELPEGTPRIDQEINDTAARLAGALSDGSDPDSEGDAEAGGAPAEPTEGVQPPADGANADGDAEEPSDGEETADSDANNG